MANTDGMGFKFVVINFKDIDELPESGKWMDALDNLCSAININRAKKNKPVNSYVVINTDEPYADEVIEIMKRNGHWG